MISGHSPFVQAFLGTLFTWGLTAAGAALVFVFQSGQRKILDGSLGFAAGVMTAASYWSLLKPALEMAEASGIYGSSGQWAFLPVTIGFVFGAGFVYGADVFMPQLGSSPTSLVLSVAMNSKHDKDGDTYIQLVEQDVTFFISESSKSTSTRAVLRKGPSAPVTNGPDTDSYKEAINLNHIEQIKMARERSWKRILLLIVAITIHNIPEGLAVGVGFGAIGKSPSATFENARNLAIGIGIQNFPEGLAVSLPLRGRGCPRSNPFGKYGQLSGMVEPVAGLLGAIAVTVAEPLLPYALAFAAGAMIYVVVDDIIPEAQTCGNGRLASWGCVVGFSVMMALDAGLG
ncbi:hypothetical protein ScPMuIL_003629 [Solemya velum]